jgi:hypothetical protein
LEISPVCTARSAVFVAALMVLLSNEFLCTPQVPLF